MYLVDTSLDLDRPPRGEGEQGGHAFRGRARQGLPFGIAGVVCGEVSRGAATLAEFERLKDYLIAQRFYHLRDPIVGYEEAARLYHRCRRGVTVRSTIDCLIARVAIEHDLSLLHDDRDFANMGRVVPELKLA